MDAARYWAAQGKQGGTAQDERAADPEEWQQAMAEYEEQFDDDAESFSVWPENETVLRVFISLRRCWRIDGMAGQFLGIDRPAIESTLRLMRIKRKQHKDVFENLMLMEDAALSVLTRK